MLKTLHPVLNHHAKNMLGQNILTYADHELYVCNILIYNHNAVIKMLETTSAHAKSC